MSVRRLIALTAVIIAMCSPGVAAWAGPPFLTDDPEPVDFHHWEFYTFLSRDQTRSTDTIQGPAAEINNGVAPNVQLHLVVPETRFTQGGMSATGLGDLEAGVKLRFLRQTKSVPDIAIFPLVELPTGSQAKGLGNGRAWYKLPVWLEKDWSGWTDYGGGGYAINSAPGQRNFWYGGDLLQRTVTKRLSLGGEMFLQGASADQTDTGIPTAGEQSSGSQVAGARWSAIWNIGGQYNFTPDFSLLFSAGHSFEGDGNAVLYVGLYRTWGPGSP
jgi:hypothetical protein